MPKLRVHNNSVSFDGYAAGPDQSLDNPLEHGWLPTARMGVRNQGRSSQADWREVKRVSPTGWRRWATREGLFDNLEGGPAGYECVELTASPSVAHIRLSRSSRL